MQPETIKILSNIATCPEICMQLYVRKNIHNYKLCNFCSVCYYF